MEAFVWWLTAIKQNHPELRICQIMSIAAKKADWFNDDLFYCPDDTLINGLEKVAEEM